MRLSDLYTDAGRKRYEDASKRGQLDVCDVCGRPLKSRDAYVIESYATGELVPKWEREPMDACCVYVGPECAKKLKGFVRSSQSLAQSLCGLLILADALRVVVWR